MSLQQCYPSPFVIMDEVDAALDTSTSSRVGQLLRRRSCINKSSRVTGGEPPVGQLHDDGDKKLQTNSLKDKLNKNSEKQEEVENQFTVVSHRPEMQIWADQIVGVYIYHGSPAAVSVAFDDGVENDVDYKVNT